MTRSLQLIAAVALLTLAGCAQVSEATLVDVVQRRASVDAYVSAVVTDVRSGRQLLVQLTDGDETVWTTGFDERPDRGQQVWTAFTGPAVEHEVVGLAYPTAGALDPPESGLTQTGAVALMLTGLLALGFVTSACTALLLRPARERRCAVCAARCGEDWVTCAHCGKALPAPSTEPPPPVSATVISPSAASARDSQADDVAPAAEHRPAPEPQTMIVHKEQ